jgi:hypothetical protein
MTLYKDRHGPSDKEPPKHKWVLPLIISIAVFALVFEVIVVIVSGKSFF